MKLYMRNGSLGQAACCLGVAYSANYRKDKLLKYKERIGINVIFFPPLWQGQNRGPQKYLVKCKRKLAQHNFLCILGP